MNLLKKKIENRIKAVIYFLLIIASINILLTFFDKSIVGNLKHFGDTELYFCALKKYAANLNPYGNMDCFGKTTMHFQYTPLSLVFLYPIKFIDLNTYKYFWIFIELLSIIAIFVYSKKIFKFNTNSFILCLFILFSFGGTGWSGFLSGNISVILSAVILFGIYKLTQDKILPYIITIIFVSLFKPYFLIFFLSGFAIYKNNFFKYIFQSLIFLIFIHFIYFYFNQDLYLNYLQVLSITTTNLFYTNFGSGIGLIGLGNGLLNKFQILNSNYAILEFIKIFWITTVFMFSLAFIFYINDVNNKIKLCYSLILASFLNPYLMNYDLYICVISILYLSENSFFYRKKVFNKLFSLCLLIFITIMHDKFACLFLLSVILFLFFINSFQNKEKRMS